MNIDNAGNVMITGEFYSSSITFGSTTLTNSGLSDIFIATYDADGNPLWARKAGAGGSDRGYGAAFDNEGNALVTGDFEGTVNFGTTSISSTNNGDDVFIVKYDSAGNELWAMGFGGAGSETGSGIVADDTGNIYACGWYYYDEFEFGGDNYPYSDLGDVFVLQVSAEGNPGWCHTFGNTSNEFAHYIECDVNNNLIVCGDFFSASLNIGGTNLTNSGNMDGFFVKYTNAGNQQWAKKCVFSQESDYASCITSDNVGNLYVTGHAGKANTQFGNGITVAQEGFFLTRYDTNGTAQWAYGDGGDIPSFAAWDQGFGVSTMNGITSVGGNFMSNALFFGDLEVAHTADFGNV
ncbi:MAG: hypothetical protein JNM00_06200, partial [Flavobacteriales bacterium]|nr:hypothetical protein [Flavobacteriales bacterium]